MSDKDKTDQNEKRGITGEELYKRVYVRVLAYTAFDIASSPIVAFQVMYKNLDDYIGYNEYITPEEEKIAKKMIRKAIRDIKKEFKKLNITTYS
jgi:hypothetical protein